MSSIKFVFPGPIRKTRRPPLPPIGRDISDFSSETAERNSTKLNRTQDLTGGHLVFPIDLKNKNLVDVEILLPVKFRWIPFSGFREVENSSAYQRLWGLSCFADRPEKPLLSLCFPGRSEKQEDPCLWLAETWFSNSLKPLNRIQRNLTGSKIFTSSTKFVFFMC